MASGGRGVVSGHDPAQKPDSRSPADGCVGPQAEGREVDYRDVKLSKLKGCLDAEACRVRVYPARDRYRLALLVILALGLLPADAIGQVGREARCA